MIRLPRTTAVRLAAVFLFSVCGNEALAQAAVRDSSPVSSGHSSTTVVAPSGGQDGASSNMAYQIQLLQQEVLELRGLVEEQAYELKRLKAQRLNDYVDLDKRISELGSNAAPVNNTVSDSAQAPTESRPPVSDSTASTAPTANAEEKKLYGEAIDLLLNQQDYQGANDRFADYLSKYPNGQHVPNVYYWQGQIYLTDSNQIAAQNAFKTLVDNYPNHDKTSDAKYKLATIYFEQDRKPESKALLEELATGDSDAARLAKAFLATQFK